MCPPPQRFETQFGNTLTAGAVLRTSSSQTAAVKTSQESQVIETTHTHPICARSGAFGAATCRFGRRRSTLSSTFKSSMRTLLRALLLPSLLMNGPTSHRIMSICGVTYSDARMAPRLSSVAGVPQGGGFDDAFLTKRAHSHNDYHQENPLASALHHGINSVEVDVFPRNDELWVGHTRFELDSSRTIANLYIEPLLNLMNRPRAFATEDPRVSAESDGRPFPQSRESQKRRMRSDSNHHDGRNHHNHLMNTEGDAITLLVDFKADAEKSVSLLQKTIAPLRPYLSKVDENGKFHKGKVTVLVSGNRPKEENLVSDGNRFIFIDGREHDIHSETDTSLVPMVSLPWRNMQIARFLGRGEAYLRNTVERAHAQGKRVRIWGAPNREKLWRQMMRSNVDLLSIDDHSKFARFASRVGFYRR